MSEKDKREKGTGSETTPPSWRDAEGTGPRRPRRQNGKMCFFFLFVMFLYVVAIVGITMPTIVAYSDKSFDKIGDGGGSGEGSVDIDLDVMPQLNAWNLSLLGTTTLVGLSGAGVILVAARFFPRVMAIMGYVMLLLSCLVSFGFKMFLGLNGFSPAFIAAIFPGLGAIVVAVFLWKGRRQIRLASLMIQTASTIAFEHASLYWVVVGSAILQLLAAASAVYGIFIVVLQIGGVDNRPGVAFFLVFFIVFCWVWLAGTISNIACTTLGGGRFSEWFITEDDTVENTSTAAFKASCTTSLGSLAWNGLLAMLIRLLVILIGFFCRIIPGMGYVTDILDDLVEMFNDYVCIVISVNDFTIGYFEAAKKTLAFSKMRGTPPKGPVAVTRSEKKWERSRQRAERRAEKSGSEPFYRGHFTHGLGAMVNFDIAGRALDFGALASAVIAAAVAAVLVALRREARAESDKDTYIWEWILPLWAFVIALLISLVVASALKTGTSTLFVCFAHHNGAHLKQVLLRKGAAENMSHVRELHDRIEEYYPVMFAADDEEAKQIMAQIDNEDEQRREKKQKHGKKDKEKV